MSYLGYRPSYYLTHPHEFVKETYLEIKWFIQRGRRGWADSDVYSFDDYLARVIHEGVERLRKSPYCGCPASFVDKDVDPALSFDYKSLDPYEAWNEELGKMAAGFKAWREREDWMEAPEWGEYDNLPAEERVEFAAKKDNEAYAKLQASLELFKKYFVNLWD